MVLEHTPTSRSCDQCHDAKQRCSSGSKQNSCRRCEQRGVLCSTSRTRLRPGRKPRTASFGPQGAINVWDLNLTDPNSARERQPISRDSLSLGDTDPQHDFPERIRVNPHPGRDCSIQSSHWGQPCTKHCSDTAEQAMVHYLSSVDCFQSFMSIFMLGPSFARTFFTAMSHLYARSPHILQDILIAMMHIRSKTTCLGFESKDAQDLERGASSVLRLRSAAIAGNHDAAVVALLGQATAAFEMLTSGTKSGLILRHPLELVKPWYPTLLAVPSIDTLTIPPIFWDTIECLIRRETPHIRFLARDSHQIDRLPGLCVTLLPILQDLCIASYRAKTQPKESSGLDSYAEVEQRLLSWTPTLLSDFTESYSEREMVAMCTQASTFRAAGLLIVHRLRHPLGAEDDVAQPLATEIIRDLSSFVTFAGPTERLPHVMLPLLVARLENACFADDWWAKTSLTPGNIAKLSWFVHYVQRQKEMGFTGLWFDLVDRELDFPIAF